MFAQRKRGLPRRNDPDAKLLGTNLTLLCLCAAFLLHAPGLSAAPSADSSKPRKSISVSADDLTSFKQLLTRMEQDREKSGAKVTRVLVFNDQFDKVATSEGLNEDYVKKQTLAALGGLPPSALLTLDSNDIPRSSEMVAIASQKHPQENAEQLVDRLNSYSKAVQEKGILVYLVYAGQKPVPRTANAVAAKPRETEAKVTSNATPQAEEELLSTTAPTPRIASARHGGRKPAQHLGEGQDAQSEDLNPLGDPNHASSRGARHHRAEFPQPVSETDLATTGSASSRKDSERTTPDSGASAKSNYSVNGEGVAENGRTQLAVYYPPQDSSDADAQAKKTRAKKAKSAAVRNLAPKKSLAAKRKPAPKKQMALRKKAAAKKPVAHSKTSPKSSLS